MTRELDDDGERLGIDTRLAAEEVGDIDAAVDGEVALTETEYGIVSEWFDIEVVAVNEIFLGLAYTGTRADVVTEFSFDAQDILEFATSLEDHLDRDTPAPVDEALTAVVEVVIQGIIAYGVTLIVDVHGIVALDAVAAAREVQFGVEAKSVGRVPSGETHQREAPFPAAARIDFVALWIDHFAESYIWTIRTKFC